LAAAAVLSLGVVSCKSGTESGAAPTASKVTYKCGCGKTADADVGATAPQ
jgi:hypothetical protein